MLDIKLYSICICTCVDAYTTFKNNNKFNVLLLIAVPLSSTDQYILIKPYMKQEASCGGEHKRLRNGFCPQRSPYTN